MIPSATPFQTTEVMIRFIASRLWNAVKGQRTPDTDHVALQRQLRTALDALPGRSTKQHGVFYLSAAQLPWCDTGIDVTKGESVTWLSAGRIYLSKPLDLWLGPNFQLWARVGETGEVFSATHDTNTFTAQTSGRLYLATYGNAEWADEQGNLENAANAYKNVAGGITVAVIRWARKDATKGLGALVNAGDPGGLATSELERIENETPRPKGWDFLWFLGPSPAYADSRDPRGRPSVHCATHRDVGILQKDAPLPLRPGTTLKWRWRVDELPSNYPEYTLPTHDYMSVAVEFDDGQDITYYWSVSLAPETMYRCPLPNWNHRETHVVVRSGKEHLGQWIEESRDLFADCERAYGKPPANIVRVWFIANSLLQRKPGTCEYADIRLENEKKTVQVL